MQSEKEKRLSITRCPQCGLSMNYNDNLIYVRKHRGRYGRSDRLIPLPGFYSCGCGNFYYTVTLKKFNPKKDVGLPTEDQPDAFN